VCFFFVFLFLINIQKYKNLFNVLMPDRQLFNLGVALQNQAGRISGESEKGGMKVTV
jgi:hypothetical protein